MSIDVLLTSSPFDDEDESFRLPRRRRRAMSILVTLKIEEDKGREEVRYMCQQLGLIDVTITIKSFS